MAVLSALLSFCCDAKERIGVISSSISLVSGERRGKRADWQMVGEERRTDRGRAVVAETAAYAPVFGELLEMPHKF